MKTLLRALLAPPLLMCSQMVLGAVGDTFSTDSLAFTITSETECEVSWKIGNITDLKVPSTVTNEGVTYTVTAIGERAFYYNSTLESCELPNTITSIGKEAFLSSPLSKINLSESLTSIGKGAFSCTPLSKINLPESLTSIGEDAFSSCQLTEVTIPKGVTVIEAGVFSSNSNLTKVTIPEGVTTIKYQAFCYTRIEEITLPESLETLGDPEGWGAGVFSGSALKSITIPNKVKRIPKNCFANCIALTEINLPDGLESIGETAFSFCMSLTKFQFPESLKEIGGNAFYQCYDLKEVSFPDNMVSIGDPDNPDYEHNYFFYMAGVTKVKLPANLEYIGPGIFSGCSIESIELPESLKYISNSAFGGCPIAELNLPSGLIEIGSGAFNGTTTPTLNLPETLKTIGESAFRGAMIEEVTLPTGIEKVAGAFSGCTKLRKALISDASPNYKSIDGVLFDKDVTRIVIYPEAHGKDFTIPASVTDISFLMGSTGLLENINVEAGNPLYSSADGVLLSKDGTRFILYPTGRPQSSYSVPESVTVIGSESFAGSTLTEIKLPSTLEVIDSIGFYNTQIQEITLPDGLKRIGPSAFLWSKLTSITIPASLEVLGIDAFSGSSQLKNVRFEDLPAGRSGSAEPTLCIPQAFYYCGAMEVYIGTSVKEIGDHAFLFTPITKLTLSEGLTKIGNEGICGTISTNEPINLGDVTFPSTLTSMGICCFRPYQYCFDSVVSRNPEPPVSEENLSYDYRFNCTLYVPAGSVEKYRNANWWKMFTNIVEIGDEPEYADLVINGDCEGDETTSFYTKYEAAGAVLPSKFTEEGMGAGGVGRAIVADVTTPPAYGNSAVFFIQATRQLRAGEEITLTMDVKAKKPCTVSTQTHYAPDNYLHWDAIGNVDFTTDWTTVTYKGKVSYYQDLGWTIAILLGEGGVNTYYFDNIHLYAEKQSGISDLSADPAQPEKVDVYTLSGVRVKQNVLRSEATEGLLPGFYIVGGKKVIIR